MATVHVWVAPLVVPDPQYASLVAALSATERERARRYRSADDARRFCVARGWLRHVLGVELGRPSAAVPVTEGPGKPRLLGRTGPCFNLSHAGELAVVAVADFEVGVDVEHCGSGEPALEAAPVACTPVELAALEQLPAGERAEAFLWLWTAKEAYLKARGVGLAVAPDSVEIGLARAGEAGSTGWWVRALHPAPGYVGAVAAEGADWEVELRHPSKVDP